MPLVTNRAASDTSVFFQAIAGFAVAVLVMLGVGGTVYQFVARDGWIAKAYSLSVAGGLAVILALLIIGLCAWLTRSWISIGDRNRRPELFVYGFAAAGAIYALQFFSKGGL